MRNRQLIPALICFLGALLLGSRPVNSREPAPAGTVPVHMVVTVEAHHGTEVPEIKQQDVTVRQGKERAQVTGWLPLRGEHAGLELFVLLDEALTSMSLGPQLDDLGRFINSQPDTTMIGVAYMRDGTADIAQNLTSEHAQAAKALRLPLGTVGAMASPYL